MRHNLLSFLELGRKNSLISLLGLGCLANFMDRNTTHSGVLLKPSRSGLNRSADLDRMPVSSTCPMDTPSTWAWMEFIADLHERYYFPLREDVLRNPTHLLKVLKRDLDSVQCTSRSTSCRASHRNAQIFSP